MYIQDHTSFTIDQDGRFHRPERVIRPFGVVLARRDTIHPGCVDRLDLAGIVRKPADNRSSRRQIGIFAPASAYKRW